MREKLNGADLSGRVRAYSCVELYLGTGAVRVRQDRMGLEPAFVWKREPVTGWQHNDILYNWATIAGTLLTAGNPQYRIAGMYLEYKNVASPSDAVAVPAFDRSGGISYYNGLAMTPDTDFLRVPLVAATLTSTSDSLFPGGNLMTFFAQSQGVTGAAGKPFGASHNSKIYGGALVAIPVLADRTQDLIFSRFYLTSGFQQVKLATSQIGLEWAITLE